MLDIKLYQEALNELSNQMNERVKTNKHLKKAVWGTYKKLVNVKKKQNPKNLPNIKKTPVKSEKVVKFVGNKNRNNKDNNNHITIIF